MPPEKTDWFDWVWKRWWASCAVGVLLIGVAFWDYGRAADVDRGARSAYSLGRSSRVFYNLGGKWLVAAVPAGVSLVFLGFGTAALVNQLKPKRP